MGRVDTLKLSQVLATTPAPSAHQNRMKPTITQLQSLLLCCYSTESRFTELAKAASAADPPAPQLLDVMQGLSVHPDLTILSDAVNAFEKGRCGGGVGM